MSVPSIGDVLAAFFASGHQAEPAELTIGPCDRIEAALDAGQPEPEASL
jgi:hypothetical protein